jgi:hypothetical protein
LATLWANHVSKSLLISLVSRLKPCTTRYGELMSLLPPECTYVHVSVLIDRVRSLAVRVPGYRFRGPSSIPGSPRSFWEVVGLERGPLSLVSTIEVLVERKNSGSGLENRDYGCRDPSRWPRGFLYPLKLALTTLICGGRSFGIVRSRTEAMEFSFLVLVFIEYQKWHKT